MKIEPIKIKISDNYMFGRIAVIVDREDFQIDVTKIRKRLKIKKLLSLDELVALGKKNLKAEYENSLDDLGISKKDLEQNIKELENGSPTDIRESFVESTLINPILSKYGLSDSYRLMLTTALFCGAITEDDLLNSEIEGNVAVFGKKNSSAKLAYNISRSGIFHEGKITLKPLQMAILIEPDTKRNEILELLSAAEKMIRTKQNNWKIPETFTNIKRDREWYWQKKLGMSYGKILKEYLKFGKKISRDAVIKAIKQYEKLLSVEV